MNKQDAIKILEHPQVSNFVEVDRLLGSGFTHLHQGMIAGARIQIFDLGSWGTMASMSFSGPPSDYRIEPEVENVTYQITTTRGAKITIDGKHTIEEIK